MLYSPQLRRGEYNTPTILGLKTLQADPGEIYLGRLPGLAQLDHDTQAAAFEACIAQFRHLFVVN